MEQSEAPEHSSTRITARFPEGYPRSEAIAVMKKSQEGTKCAFAGVLEGKMKHIRKPKIRYGSVKRRGIHPKKLEIIRSSKRHQEANRPVVREKMYYTVVAGTYCHVRTGDGEWIEHVTTKEITCHGFVRIDPVYYFLVFQKWEIRVRRADVVVSPVKE